MRLPWIPLALAVLVAAAPLALSDDKDAVYLDGVEKVELKDPLLRVQRPSKDWVFLNLELMNKQALAKNPNDANARAAQERLKARLWSGGSMASFFVYAWKDEREDLSVDTLGPEQLESTRGFLKDKGKVVASTRTRHGKLDAWGFEVEGTLLSGGDELVVSKLVVLRPADKRVFLVSLEHPKKYAETVKKDKPRLFANVKL